MKLSSLLISLFFDGRGVECKKPNVIILLADDIGMGDISLNNINGKIKTPNIDRIGLEGVNFLDAHSASTKCSPSRYMLMTGRYSFHNPKPHIRKLYAGTPHLADMFKRNGYRTGIVGKTAPLNDAFEALDADPEKALIEREKLKLWKQSLGGGTGGDRGPGEDKASFSLQANYTQSIGAFTMNYDYAFLNQYACCRVGGGYFENGVGVEPFSKYAVQRPYPEGSNQWNGPICQPYKSFDGEDRCGHKPFANGYVAAPFFDERVEGPVLVPNFPPSILVQPSYDSRTIETRISDKAVDFIRSSAKKDEPFFLYYGFRAGHNPFNSDPKFRGTSDVGEIGEAILELDHNVGRVLNVLKNFGILDDTIIIFMSDNGAITRGNAVESTLPYPDGSYLWDTYQHYQNSMTTDDGVWHKFRGGKNSAYEGGNRMPFLWRYPKMIKKPRVDPNSIVTYIDVYRTLAEMIGDPDLACNEAPDSRSLVGLLTGEQEVMNETVVLHSVFQGVKSIRMGSWKLISGSQELFNLETDMEEMNNLYEQEPQRVARMTKELDARIANINAREERQDEGRNGADVC